MTATWDIRAGLELLIEPGSTFEIRIPKAGKVGTVRGYFQDLDKAAKAASGWSGKAAGIYVTLNPVHPALYARAAERLESYAKSTTSDPDIIRRRWLPIDLDPVRPAGISSSDAEHDAALALALKIRDALTASGWPEPIYADSGNGAHLLYRVDILNDDHANQIIETSLKALAARFSTPAVKLDTAVGNASRIWKLYGTMACKGDSVPDRPHRMARILSSPETTNTVSLEQLADVASTLQETPTPSKQQRRAASAGAGPSETTGEDVDSALAALNPDMPYQDWLAVGMALHDWNGAGAFERWDRWSAGGSKYHEKDCSEKWKGFQGGGGMTVATLFKMAKDAGWKRTRSRQREQFQVPDDRPSAIPGEQRQLIDLALRFQTDLGNSERLIVRHGRDIRYCFDFGKWLVWDGVRWAIDRDGAALDKAKDTARKMLAEAATLDDTDDSRKLAAWSFRSQARERLAAMLFLAQSDVSVRPEHLDTHPWLLNVANGTLDLRTGKLRPADRADLLTKAAPVVYDPAATCPEWLAFLARIFDGNAEIIRYVQKAVGYSLTGDDREQAFFVCYGVGRNGKSTLLETLAALLGEDYAQQAAPELLMQKTHDRHPTELAALRGMRLVTAIETGEGRRLNEPLVKQLTGGDRISARFMRGDFFTFTPTHKLWLATNHKPTIRGTDLGMWRRIKLIPFIIQISEEEKDEGLKDRMKGPVLRPGILNWAIEGVLLWQREGLKPPQAVSAATQAYREEMDVLAAWIADCCVIAKQAEASAADLYRSYGQWREQNGERAETQTSFGLRLTERGFERVKRRNGWVWYGIGLLKCDPCDPCDPISNIATLVRGGKVDYTENGVAPVTPVTPPPGRSTQAHPVATDPKARRIMEQLRAMPAGVADEELKRAVCTDNGCSPALVDFTLMRLAKAGSLGKVNGRWVLMGNRL